jgi:hypothetical protein
MASCALPGAFFGVAGLLAPGKTKKTRRERPAPLKAGARRYWIHSPPSREKGGGIPTEAASRMKTLPGRSRKRFWVLPGLRMLSCRDSDTRCCLAAEHSKDGNTMRWSALRLYFQPGLRMAVVVVVVGENHALGMLQSSHSHPGKGAYGLFQHIGTCAAARRPWCSVAHEWPCWVDAPTKVLCLLRRFPWDAGWTSSPEFRAPFLRAGNGCSWCVSCSAEPLLLLLPVARNGFSSLGRRPRSERDTIVQDRRKQAG